MIPLTPPTRHRPFSLVLAGGGARGFAHLGVLRAFEEAGCRPSALVGVSMGALIAATYSLREDWFDAVESMDTSGFPPPGRRGRTAASKPPSIRSGLGRVHVAWNMVTGWGASDHAVEAGLALLSDIFGDLRLEDGRVPVVACASDLLSGARVELSSGLAREAVYASAALVGIIPPLERNGRLLADGAYTDIAPVDVARAMTPAIVIVVDPSQPSGATDIHNGVQAVMRAMEICHLRHAELRFREADVVIKPAFSRYVDTLDFEAREECILAGVEAGREAISRILELITIESTEPPEGPGSGP